MAVTLYDRLGKALVEDSGWAWPDHLEEDTYDIEQAEPYAGRQAERLGLPTFDWVSLREWTWQERREVLARTHWAWERNPLAKLAVRLIQAFVIGEGMSVVAHGQGIQEILDTFTKTPYFQNAERDFFSQLLVDGELFLLLAEGLGRRRLYELKPISMRPWRIMWIQTDPEDYTQRQAYHIQHESWDGRWGMQPVVTKEEDVPASEILHVAVNNLSYELRGRSELFTILPWLTAYSQWLERRILINRMKGYVYHLQIKGASPSQVTTKRSNLAKPIAPGSLYVSSDQEQLKELGGTIEAGRVAEDGRQIKLMAAVGVGLPEFMLADGYNANMATAKAQQLPALRLFADYQDLYVQEVWKPIFTRLINGVLGEGTEVDELDKDGNPTGKRILAANAFTISYPDIEAADPRNLAEALQVAVANRWVSNRTASARMGFDYAKERMIIGQEEEDDTLAVTQGRTIRNPRSEDGKEEQEDNHALSKQEAASRRQPI